MIAHFLPVGSAQCDPALEFLGLLNDQPIPVLAERDLRGLQPQLRLDARGPRLIDHNLLLPRKLLQFRGIEPTELVSLFHRRAVLDHADDHRPFSIRDVLDLAGDDGLFGRLQIAASHQRCIQVDPPNLDAFEFRLRQAIPRLLAVRGQQADSPNERRQHRNPRPHPSQ